MRKRAMLAGAAVVAAGLLPPSVQAAPSAQDPLASVQYLLGTWNCKHTFGTFSGTYVTTYTPALDNRWLRQIYDFPQSSEGPAMKAEFLMSYDPKLQGWVRFGALSTGQYFAIRVTDANSADPAWNFKYISFAPRRAPETPVADATFTKKSDTQYTVDGPTYPLNGTGPIVTEHHVCEKTAP